MEGWKERETKTKKEGKMREIYKDKEGDMERERD